MQSLLTETATTATEENYTITLCEAIVRVATLLDVVNDRLLDVQSAIESCVKNHHLTEQEIQDLQRVDSATQGVEGLALVLRNLVVHADTKLDTPISVDSLCQGVFLYNVLRVMRGETVSATLMTRDHIGEVDLF